MCICHRIGQETYWQEVTNQLAIETIGESLKHMNILGTPLAVVAHTLHNTT